VSETPTWFAPGWYPDPTGRHETRWYDGGMWTAHVADAGTTSRDPLAPGATGSPAPQASSQAGASATTRDPRARTALILALVALPLALLPFAGALIAAIALGLAIAVRRRPATTASTRTTGGWTIAIATVALLLGASTTWGTLMLRSTDGGGLLGDAFRSYAACAETRPADVCQRELRAFLEERMGSSR
jgi:hypothetical protein